MPSAGVRSAWLRASAYRREDGIFQSGRMNVTKSVTAGTIGHAQAGGIAGRPDPVGYSREYRE
jgi:hypothetical protein